MQYDLQQLNELTSNLELDIEKTTDSEKELREFFKLKEFSTSYYLENIDAVNSLLNCCVQSDDTESSIDSNKLSTIYELLRNDLYKYKSKEIKDKNIEFDQIDQLEFFNFLSKLYSDPDFIEQHTQKDSTLLLQVKEIQEKLEIVLKHQIEEYFKDPEKFKKVIKKFNFQSRQELYDEAYNRLMHLDISSCLKNIYYKDSLFTVADDVRMLFQLINTEFVPEQRSKIKEFLKFNIDVPKDKEFLCKLGAVFAGAGAISAISSPFIGSIGSLLLFGSIFGQNLGLVSFTDSVSRHIQRSSEKADNALNKEDVVEQKYRQLEDDAFYNVALAVRYNNDAFEELKKLENILSDKTISEEERALQFNDTFSNCVFIQRSFEKLEKTLKRVSDEKNFEIRRNSRLKEPYTVSEEFDKKSSEILKHFQKFSRTDFDKLIRLVRTSSEKTRHIQELIKTAQLFDKDLSTIKTFDQLMFRIQDNTVKKQNSSQKYLESVLNSVEKTLVPERMHRVTRSAV